MLTFAWLSGLIIALLYSKNIWNYFNLNFGKVRHEAAKDLPPVTVIVPFRNEAQNLKERIRSLEFQNYPVDSFEVFLVNDHSTDEFNIHLDELKSNFKVLHLPENLTGKAAALTYAIDRSNSNWIICTDADCVAGPEWLREMFSLEMPAHVNGICGPVRIDSNYSPLQELQFLDMIGVMGMTAAGHRGLDFTLANGANFAFKKSSFYDVGGFEGSEKWLAAEDMWLVNRLTQLHPESILFIDTQEAEVITYPESTWKGFLEQRIRWAGKTASYKSNTMLYHVGLPFAFSFYLIVTGLLSIFYSSFIIPFWVFVLFRISCDFSYLNFMTKKYGHRLRRKTYLLVQFFHIFYIVCAGLISLGIKQYKWKDRILK